jgi:hypothetical protein
VYQLRRLTKNSGGPDTLLIELYELMRSKQKTENVSVTNQPIYQPTPESKIFLENLIVPQLF